MSGIRLRAWGLGELEQVGSLQKMQVVLCRGGVKCVGFGNGKKSGNSKSDNQWTLGACSDILGVGLTCCTSIGNEGSEKKLLHSWE